MANVVQNVQTIFSVTDMASRNLAGMGNAVTRVNSMFDRASNMVGMFGAAAGLAAGAFSATRAITGTLELLDTTDKIRRATGMSAIEAGGLADVMGDVGIKGFEATRMLTMMSRASERANTSAQKARKGLSGSAELYKQLGILGKKPEDQLMQMAKSAQDGKLEFSKLQTTFRMNAESAHKMMRLLEKGPEHIKKAVAESKRLGITTDENVARALRIREAQNRIASLWEKIQQVVAIQLLPVIEKLLKQVEDKLGGWLENAKAFGETLGNFLQQHLDLVIRIGKVMMANFLLMKMTGTGIGGWAMKLGGGAKGMLGGMVGPMPGRLIGPASGRAAGQVLGDIKAGFQLIPDYAKQFGRQISGSGRALLGNVTNSARFVSGAVRNSGKAFMDVARGGAAVFRMGGPRALLGMVTTVGRRVATTGFSGGMRGLVAVVQAIFRLRPLLTVLLRAASASAIIGFIIAVVVKAFQLIYSNVDGIRTHLMLVFSGIVDRFRVIFDMLKPLGDLFSSSGPVGQLFHEFVFGVLVMFGDALDGMVHTLQVIIYMFAHIGDALISPIETFQKGWSETQRMTEEKERQRGLQEAIALGQKRKKEKMEAAAAEKPPKMVQDFRGSKFEITQKFAEGFDPDRVAVAFSSDLADLGERQLQSGFSPLFAVR